MNNFFMQFDYWDIKTDIELSREWSMPNKWTFQMKPIYNFIIDSINNNDVTTILLPYAGMTRFPHNKLYTYIDINPEMPQPCHYGDAVDVLESFINDGKTFDMAIVDPPFTEFQRLRTYRNKKRSNITVIKDQIKELGVNRVITCGFNSNGMGKSRGFKKERLIIVATGGNHNDFLILEESRI